MQRTEFETFYPKNKEEWRAWLKKNHHSMQSVWLLQYKQKSTMPSISWSEAVDEALCFGWIDSTRRSLGEDRFIQFFTKRKPKSNWSKINKVKVEQLISKGLMTEAGFKSIEIAKQNGSWTILDTVEELFVPKDLEEAFHLNPGAKEYFNNLSKSAKKMLLHWVIAAKRPETREKRITEIAELAGQGLKPKQFR